MKRQLKAHILPFLVVIIAFSSCSTSSFFYVPYKEFKYYPDTTKYFLEEINFKSANGNNLNGWFFKPKNKIQRRQQQEHVFEETDLWFQLQEIAEAAAVGDPHIGLDVLAPFAKLKEIDARRHIASQVSEPSKHREKHHQQQEKPTREFWPVGQNQHDAEGDFKDNHGN